MFRLASRARRTPTSDRSAAPRAVGPVSEVSVDRLRALGTGVFAELQRADAKAAMLAATAGAGLGAVFTMVTAFAKTMPLGGVVGAGCASACFALSVWQCLSAMRPSLRPGNRRRPDCYLDCAEVTADELLAAVTGLSAWEVARAESRRVTELSTLAQAKFTLLRRAALFSQLALAAACLSAACVLLNSLTGT